MQNPKEENGLVVRESDEYKQLVEECSAILTEYSFTSRWALIEGYFALGQRLREESNTGVKMTSLVKNVAQDMEINERNLWYAIQAVDKFGTVDKLPDGKSISWSKIKNELPAHKKRVLREFEPSKIASKLFYKHGVENSISIIKELRNLVDDHEEDTR